MHALALFHTHFINTFNFIHSHRLQSLLVTTESLLHGSHCSLTSLGRHIVGPAKVKNKIKRVDRLLGNSHLHKERLAIYHAIAEKLLSGLSEAVIIVDWSPYHYSDYQVLKATIAVQGRSITLYEEVHSQKQYQKHFIHKAFIEKLKQVIPTNLNVIVVTDAGFTNKWFKLILNQGWHFVGRIPSFFKYRYLSSSHWRKAAYLTKRYTPTPKLLGDIELAQSNPIHCRLIVCRERLKGRKKTLKRQMVATMDKRYSASYRSTWILVTSLKKKAKKIVKYYKFRMQIEQNFRDTKNPRWGMGLRYGHSHSIQRLEILLLLTSIAQCILWLIGWIAEQQKWHYDYQVNTIKDRRVLSFVYLGQQILYHQPHLISRQLWDNGMSSFPIFLSQIYE